MTGKHTPQITTNEQNKKQNKQKQKDQLAECRAAYEITWIFF